MKYCDITITYNERSGGIRTYIDEKRRYLLENTKHEHLLIVPAAYNYVEYHERSKTVYVNSPLLPKQDSYRFFLRLGKIRNILLKEAPDVIELGSYYGSPWAAFGYRERMRETGRDCVIGCYFHTDIAGTYVAAPLRALAQEWLGRLSEPLAGMAGELADVAAVGVERYVGAVFEQCDIAFVPSPTQAARLHRYGVRHVHVLPLGVDLRSFHPRHRSDDIRARYGADPDSLVRALGD